MSSFTPEEFFTRYSSLILEFITNFDKQILEKIRDNDDYIKEPERYFYTILHKTKCSLEAANIFIRNFDSNRNLHTPLFVILRSILSDIIVSEFVILEGKNDSERIELIERIYFDHYDNILNTIEKTASIVYEWDKKELEENKDVIKNLDRFYNSDGSPKIKPLKTSPATLVKRIFSQNKDKKSLKILKLSFDLYSTFSKLEHLGGLSFGLTHRGYSLEDKPIITEDLYYSVRVIINVLCNYSKLWDDLEADHSYFSNLLDQISSMTPDKIRSY
jgi:hypothetical protein